MASAVGTVQQEYHPFSAGICV